MRDASSSGAGTTAVSSIRRRFLFAHWEGGGNTPPTVSIVRRLVARGHEVRVVGDGCNREEFEVAGATFAPWTRIPLRRDKSAESDPIKDWEVAFPLTVLSRIRDRLFVGPSRAYALDLLSELERFPPDAIVTSEMLLGVMAAAERARIPCAVLSPNIYLFPLPGVPPFGPGFLPAKGLGGQARDILVEKLSLHVFGRGTGAFNETRNALGLPPLSHPFEQTARVARHLVLTSTAFDFPATSLPKHVVYTGPELDDPEWAEPWSEPWPDSDRRPLVIVGFSSTFQNHASALIRVIDALSTLNIRAVLTVGPALDLDGLPRTANVLVCRSAPHELLNPLSASAPQHDRVCRPGRGIIRINRHQAQRMSGSAQFVCVDGMLDSPRHSVPSARHRHDARCWGIRALRLADRSQQGRTAPPTSSGGHDSRGLLIQTCYGTGDRPPIIQGEFHGHADRKLREAREILRRLDELKPLNDASIQFRAAHLPTNA